MQILRMALFAVAVVVLVPVTASAQQLIAGSPLYFTHSQADVADTESYQLCASDSTMSDPICQQVGVTRVGTTDTYTFTVPDWVPRGNRVLFVRAVGYFDVGMSGPSNSLQQRIIGRPGPPTNFRTTEAIVP